LRGGGAIPEAEVVSLGGLSAVNPVDVVGRGAEKMDDADGVTPV
jgi:hypothetical protein